MTHVSDDEVLRRIRLRHHAFVAIRRYFAEENFYEIDAPQVIAANCVEANIDPLKVTFSLPQPIDLYLHTSPEVAAKRLLAAGAQKIYQLSHVFRDGETGKKHLPEFCLLEWYRAHADLQDLINDCQKLFNKICDELSNAQPAILHYKPQIDFKAPFEVFTVEELWQKFAGIDLRAALKAAQANDLSFLRRILEAQGESLSPSLTFDDCFHLIMLKFVEPNIGHKVPCVVIKWPARMAALAKRCEDDHLFAHRFEIYAGGHEIANAFFELTDPVEQRARFQKDNEERVILGKNALPLPESMITNLAKIPQSSGIAVGIDRLLMAISGSDHIKSIYPLQWGSI